MNEQLQLDLRSARREALRFDAAFAFDWRKLNRRARRLVTAIAPASPEGIRAGFALRRYAEDAALLEALRAQLAGKPLKQAARKAGRRLPVKAVVVFAASRQGRRLHALVDQVEERLAAREAETLCG